MEERKRPFSDEIPPAKRHAGLVQEEVEAFQREALWRALQESRRQQQQQQEELQVLRKTYSNYDSSMREMQMWWDQMEDEIRLFKKEEEREETPWHKLFSDPTKFRHVLNSKKDSILRILRILPPNLQVDLPLQTQELLGSVQRLSLDVKQLKHELERAAVEKDEKDSRIAQLTYNLKAINRAVDRNKSLTLKRIFKTDEETEPVPVDTQRIAQLQAINDSQSQQLAEINDRYAKLLIQLETLKSESVPSLLPPKEATHTVDILRQQNNALSEQITELVKENDNFKQKLLAEQTTALDEMNALLSRTNGDLTRIRSMRDELFSELAIRKATADSDLQSSSQLAQLSDARLSRIQALELEIERWKSEPVPQVSQSILDMSVEELHQKVARLEKQNATLAAELPALETAFNKAHQLSISKLLDLSDSHLKTKKAQAEKAKADQKFFAAMKAKDSLSMEIKTLKSDLSKTGDIIKKLQASEKGVLEKLAIHERTEQLLKLTLDKYEVDQSLKQQEIQTLSEKNASYKKENELLREAKSFTVQTIKNEIEAKNQAELESKKLALKLSYFEAGPSENGSNQHLQVYRSASLCSVCKKEWKQVAITKCGHLFCKGCVDKQIETRQRRCPSCNQNFGTGDILNVHL